MRSQGALKGTLKGTEASLSYIQCFLYIISSSVNVYFSYHMAGYLLDRPRIYVSRGADDDQNRSKQNT